MNLSAEQQDQLDNVLTEFPTMQKKLKALTRAVEMIDLEGMKKQLSKSITRSVKDSSYENDASKEMSNDTPRQSDSNRLSIKVDMM